MTSEPEPIATLIAAARAWHRTYHAADSTKAEDHSDSILALVQAVDALGVVPAAPAPHEGALVEALRWDRDFIGKALHEECIHYNRHWAVKRYQDAPWDQISEKHREHHRLSADHVVEAARGAASPPLSAPAKDDAGPLRVALERLYSIASHVAEEHVPAEDDPAFAPHGKELNEALDDAIAALTFTAASPPPRENLSAPAEAGGAEPALCICHQISVFPDAVCPAHHGLTLREAKRQYDLAEVDDVRSTAGRERTFANEMETGPVTPALRVALGFAQAAIRDAIYDEDGMDGEAGERLLCLITEALKYGTHDQRAVGRVEMYRYLGLSYEGDIATPVPAPEGPVEPFDPGD